MQGAITHEMCCLASQLSIMWIFVRLASLEFNISKVALCVQFCPVMAGNIYMANTRLAMLNFVLFCLGQPNILGIVSLGWSATNSCFTLYAILRPYSINSI